MNNRTATFALLVIGLLLTGCGGGGGATPPPSNNPPPAPAGIGAAGGTVAIASGAKVVVPAGALSSTVVIEVAEVSSGAPALPAGVVAAGAIYAFTPHGTSFAVPAAMTVPFDPARVPAGATPTLYKTNSALTVWEPVAGATVTGSTMVGNVSGFSDAVVGVPATNLVLNNSHTWRLSAHLGNGDLGELESGHSDNAEVNVHRSLGDAVLRPLASQPQAYAEVYASLTGDRYWSAVQAPVAIPRASDGGFDASTRIGAQAYLQQIQTFRKTTDAASLQLVISAAALELVDSNPESPRDSRNCSKFTSAALEVSYLCGNLLDANLRFEIRAFKEIEIKDGFGNVTGFGVVDLAHGSVFAHLYGHAQGVGSPYPAWQFNSGTDAASNLDFDVAPHYDYDSDVGTGADHTHATATLAEPATLYIPLDAVQRDEQFIVVVNVTADANNLRQHESYASALFVDPQQSSGLTYVGHGVEVVATPQTHVITPPVIDVQPAAACTTDPDPASGSLQFQAATDIVTETGAGGAYLLWITRSGGGAGAVSALITTHDGSARAGTDFSAVSTRVRFLDGEQGQRYVEIPLLNNSTTDGTREFTATLSGLSGCAVLGAPATITVAIKDDEPAPPTPTYTLGGTVSGLAGTGLTVQTGSGEQLRPMADGAFTFATALEDGVDYTVSIVAQPANPVQICSVANGSGSVNGANVTDIAVTCITPQPVGSLDGGFGSGGKLTSASSAARAVALQADGRIVVVGGKTLSRFNADGTPDTSFGTAGRVTVVMGGGSFEALETVAVQADGRIVVAGHTSTPPSLVQDFTLQRFNADGSLDPTFGIGGKVLTDFTGTEDAANAMVIQSDGKLVVAGITILGTGASADEDMAVARYLSDGMLDPAFGTGGKTTINVAGKADFGYAVALQADGRIVVAGRVGVDGGSDPDFGLVRLTTTGQLDASFGSAGRAQIEFAANTWDEAWDLAIQADGRIITAGYARIGATQQYAVMRLNGDGSLDTTFDLDGKSSTGLTTGENFGRALALQADGSLIVIGQVSSLSNADMGVLRLRSNGAVDPAFGAAGLIRVDFFGATDNARDVVIQPDGRILVVGSAVNGSAGLAAVRINP